MGKVNQERYWTAFYTKPRHEKKCADRLGKQGYEIFMPLREELRIWSDRKKKVYEPLFKSYLFVKVSEIDRLAVLQDSSVVRNLFWLKQPVIIRDEEIQVIKDFLDDFPVATAQGITFAKNDSIQINDGVLAGKKGVVREKRGHKYLIQLEQLDMELIAEIHENFIVPTKS